MSNSHRLPLPLWKGLEIFLIRRGETSICIFVPVKRENIAAAVQLKNMKKKYTKQRERERERERERKRENRSLLNRSEMERRRDVEYLEQSTQLHCSERIRTMLMLMMKILGKKEGKKERERERERMNTV